MDIGYWIRTFQFTIYGQKVYLGMPWTISMEHLPLIIYGHLLLLEDEAIYYFKWISHLLDVITTMSILINGTLILDLLHTSHSNKTISSSDVAIDLYLYILWDTLRTNPHN